MIPLYTVDAFSERPFAGNPAAICLLDRPLRARVRGARVDLIGRAVTVLRGELADGAV